MREREKIGFKELFKVFWTPNPDNSNYIKIDLEEIEKQEDKKQISRLERALQASENAKAGKGGKRRKQNKLDIPMVETKPVKEKQSKVKAKEKEER